MRRYLALILFALQTSPVAIAAVKKVAVKKSVTPEIPPPKNKNPDTGKMTEVEWPTLGQLNYDTGKIVPQTDPLTKKAMPDLNVVDGKSVRIPGFMIPLDYKDKSVTEFLLVPALPACIHVPPPPPNQTIHVKMKTGSKTAMSDGAPIWVEGQLQILKKKVSGEMPASYEMTGFKTEAYQFKK